MAVIDKLKTIKKSKRSFIQHIMFLYYNFKYVVLQPKCHAALWQARRPLLIWLWSRQHHVYIAGLTKRGPGVGA